MRSPVACLLSASLSVLPAAALGQSLVVTNKASATASIISLATGRVVATLPTGEGPHEVAASHDGRLAVVTDYGAQTPGASLTLIDVPGRRVLRTIELSEYRRPHGVAFLPGDSLIAVTSEATANVILVRVADGAVARALPTGQRGSHMLAVTGAGDRIYTANIPDHTVTEIDLATGAATRMFPVPRQPEAITVSANGATVWVGSNSEGSVSQVNTATGTARVVATGFGWPYRVHLTADGRLALVPDYRGGELRILDAVTGAERGRVALSSGPQGLAASPDSRTAYVSLTAVDRVAVIDLQRMAVVNEIPLEAGSRPDGVAYLPR